ncbi:MAG: adenosine deaminase [Rhodoferax sp.]|nr:adenosine deaminase [Rhodoferax sp.]
MPKAELHMHIEGSIEPELFLQLAERNAVQVPWSDVDTLRAAYDFRDLQSFLDLYYDGCRVLVHAQDFHDVTRAYLRRAHADGVIHAELFLGPQGHTSRGVAMATVLEGVWAAMREAQREDGLSSGLILLAQRHRSEAEAFELFEQAMPWAEHLLGFGLGGAEVGHPPSKFERFFAHCRSRGMRVVAHAGEEGPASYVREAVELLQVDRIDHGNACVDDEALLRQLAESRTPLTVCPLSNLRLKVSDSLDTHVLPRLLQAGLCVTLNSDDPSFFGGYINDNFLQCQQTYGWAPSQLVELARNSLDASFLPEPQRRAALARLDAFVARAPRQWSAA